MLLMLLCVIGRALIQDALARVAGVVYITQAKTSTRNANQIGPSAIQAWLQGQKSSTRNFQKSRTRRSTNRSGKSSTRNSTTSSTRNSRNGSKKVATDSAQVLTETCDHSLTAFAGAFASPSTFNLRPPMRQEQGEKRKAGALPSPPTLNLNLLRGLNPKTLKPKTLNPNP